MQSHCHWAKDIDAPYHLHRDLVLSLFLSLLPLPLLVSPLFLCHWGSSLDALMPSSALLAALLFAWLLALGLRLLQLPSHWKRHLLSLFLSSGKAVVKAFLGSCCPHCCRLLSHPRRAPQAQSLGNAVALLLACHSHHTMSAFGCLCWPHPSDHGSSPHVVMGPPWVSVLHRVPSSSEWAGLGIRSCVVVTAQGYLLLSIPAPLQAESLLLSQPPWVSLHGTLLCHADTLCTQNV